MTREVANWFHDRDGELFTVDETPFTREEIVQVVNDSVDPVQQVMVEGEKYVGVISFEEHNGWYEYTRWDDSAGEVNIGVCAKCVQQAERPQEVSRTIGDSTNIAREKFENHYSNEHSVKPDEIETGATLLSGTTINGNEAIHPGMDGSGSGVDADFVLGNEALQTGSFYSFTSPFIVNQIPTQSGGGQMAVSDCIWLAYGSTYRLDKNGNLKDTLSINGGAGVDVDNNNCLWTVDGGTNSLYKHTLSGSLISGFNSPSSFSEGVAVDSDNCLWHIIDQDINKFNQSGTVQSTFTESSIDPRDVGVGENDCVWVVSDSPNTISKKNKSGTEIDSFNTPSSGTIGGDKGKDFFWSSDYFSECIYKLNVEDNVLEFN